jgi:hypothetical protein
VGSKRSAVPEVAFINLPYAKQYERVYLAYIAGVSGYGLVPTPPCAIRRAGINSIAFST